MSVSFCHGCARIENFHVGKWMTLNEKLEWGMDWNGWMVIERDGLMVGREREREIGNFSLCHFIPYISHRLTCAVHIGWCHPCCELLQQRRVFHLFLYCINYGVESIYIYEFWVSHPHRGYLYMKMLNKNTQLDSIGNKGRKKGIGILIMFLICVNVLEWFSSSWLYPASADEGLNDDEDNWDWDRTEVK